MKIAYFSPFNPQKSGISAYSEILISYLKKYFEIDLWTDTTNLSNPALSGYNKIFYSDNKKIRKKLEKYDLLVYNIGNNPEFHGKIYDVFLEFPGIVILHDYILYFLITGYHLDQKKDEKGYIKEFYFNYGRTGIDEVKKLLRSSTPPLQYQKPEDYPLIKRILQKAKGIIVHSDYSRSILLKMGYPSSKIVHINHINLSPLDVTVNIDNEKKIRKELNINPGELLIASFGFIAPTKRNLESIEVINSISKFSKQKIKYLMVGEGNYIDNYLSKNIQKTGYIDIGKLEILIRLADIVINLRNPSMGETSGTLIRAMSAGKPCIVSDVGWFSELPDDSVMKISCNNEKEKIELANVLNLLIDNVGKREKIGLNAREYILRNCAPEKIAYEMKTFFEFCYNN